jgi:hypothetical protein
MKEFKFSCPPCSQHIQTSDALIGRQFQGPNCNHLIRVPRPFGREETKSGTVETGKTWDTFIPPADEK